LRIRCSSRDSKSRFKLINSFLSYSCGLIYLLAEIILIEIREVNTASPLAPLLAATLTSDAALSALAFAVAFAAAALFWAAAFPFPFAFFLAAAAAPASAVVFPAAALFWAADFPFPFPFAFFLAAAAAPASAVAFLDLPAMTAFSFATLAEAWASAAVCSHPLALSSLIEKKME
jgi:hypothetical protein